MKITCQIYLYQQYCLNFLQFLCYFPLDYAKDNFSNVSHINQDELKGAADKFKDTTPISNEHYAGEGIQINCSTGKKWRGVRSQKMYPLHGVATFSYCLGPSVGTWGSGLAKKKATDILGKSEIQEFVVKWSS